MNEEACREQFPACSTFKVPLAVMAFDSGVLSDEKRVLKWDGKKDLRPEVNKDHDAQTWMRDSVVWFSQRLTPQIGPKRVQKYLNDFSYGNKNLKDGLTQAWLTSPSHREGALNISAYEQVDFLKKLWSHQLPVSERSMVLTQKIMFLEKSPQGFELHGKTGSNFFDKERRKHFGWFVGHVQRGEQEYIVVTHLSDLTAGEGRAYGGTRAKQLTKEILQDKGLW